MKTPSPRAAAVVDLYHHAAALAAAGDPAGAAAVHEAILRLLRAAGTGDNGQVVNLDVERAKRGGR